MIQRRCIPGLMYRFFMAHSSRMDANFLNGAPEFNNVSNKSRISGMTIEHICFKSRKQTFKLNHGLLDHRFELAYTWKFETLEKETLYHKQLESKATVVNHLFTNIYKPTIFYVFVPQLIENFMHICYEWSLLHANIICLDK